MLANFPLFLDPSRDRLRRFSGALSCSTHVSRTHLYCSIYTLHVNTAAEAEWTSQSQTQPRLISISVSIRQYIQVRFLSVSEINEGFFER